MKENTMHYDVIGDIHGHSQPLERLLKTLGYTDNNGYYHHSERKAIFLGDLIDRGSRNFRVLDTVKTMVEKNSALIVMGNHEYNALCFHTQNPQGNYLRPHSPKNISQHKEVLAEIETEGAARWEIYMEWFRHLPLYLDLEGIRIVHACWAQDKIDFVKKNHFRDGQGRLTDEFLFQSAIPGTIEFNTIETLLKGLEIPLPDNHPGVKDRDNILRKQLRLKWWINRNELENAKTYDRIARVDDHALENITGLKIPGNILSNVIQPGTNRDTNQYPVFFGHYWFDGQPQLLNETAACLDYSIAKGGKLVCYRWDGEQHLSPDKFVWV